MKKNYITAAFQKTVARRFPEQSGALRAAYTQRLSDLRAEYANASKQKRRHLENQIMPGIAAYETLQNVMPKRGALRCVHGYVAAHARRMRRVIRLLLRIPGLYRLVPGVFATQTPKLFGETAGFADREIRVSKGVWRIDMTKCPYNDVCTEQGCPELCCCFCDSDDIAYGSLHPKLFWHRTKTLGHGGDCCDFCMRVRML